MQSVTILFFSALLFLIAIFAGLMGALTGMGGGFIITPVLVLGFGVDIHYALGASLITVLATSTGGNILYLKQGYSNLRIGMLLEVSAVIGALVGAVLVSYIASSYISILFGCILLVSAYFTIRRNEAVTAYFPSHHWAHYFQLEGSYPTKQGMKKYSVYHVRLALFFMGIAGMLSGLLGIGSGSLKVLAMDQAMKLPYKVSTATSNFMIGITAGVSVGIYFSQGYIDPLLTFPIMLGVLIGAMSGAKILPKIQTAKLRLLFSVVILIFSVQMIYKGLTGL
jgi:uncharacterized membrane protein YfcA